MKHFLFIFSFFSFSSYSLPFYLDAEWRYFKNETSFQFQQDVPFVELGFTHSVSDSISFKLAGELSFINRQWKGAVSEAFVNYFLSKKYTIQLGYIPYPISYVYKDSKKTAHPPSFYSSLVPQKEDLAMLAHIHLIGKKLFLQAGIFSGYSIHPITQNLKSSDLLPFSISLIMNYGFLDNMFLTYFQNNSAFLETVYNLGGGFIISTPTLSSHLKISTQSELWFIDQTLEQKIAGYIFPKIDIYSVQIGWRLGYSSHLKRLSMNANSLSESLIHVSYSINKNMKIIFEYFIAKQNKSQFLKEESWMTRLNIAI